MTSSEWASWNWAVPATPALSLWASMSTWRRSGSASLFGSLRAHTSAVAKGASAAGFQPSADIFLKCLKSGMIPPASCDQELFPDSVAGGAGGQYDFRRVLLLLRYPGRRDDFRILHDLRSDIGRELRGR